MLGDIVDRGSKRARQLLLQDLPDGLSVGGLSTVECCRRMQAETPHEAVVGDGPAFSKNRHGSSVSPDPYQALQRDVPGCLLNTDLGACPRGESESDSQCSGPRRNATRTRARAAKRTE